MVTKVLLLLLLPPSPAAAREGGKEKDMQNITSQINKSILDKEFELCGRAKPANELDKDNVSASEREGARAKRELR